MSLEIVLVTPDAELVVEIEPPVQDLDVVLETEVSEGTSGQHTHPISDVQGLQAELSGKAPSSHSHSILDVSNLATTLNNKADASHSHQMSGIAGLTTALDGKAPVNHSHDPHNHDDRYYTETEIDERFDNLPTGSGTGDMLKAVYDQNDSGKVDDAEKLQGQSGSHYLSRTNHTGEQAIATISGLTTALSGKAPVSHFHDWSDIDNVPEYAPLTHAHSTSEVTNLDSILSGKADTSHSHDYAATNHNHDGVYSTAGHTHDWDDVQNKPSTFTPSAHEHDYAAENHNHDSDYSALGYTHPAPSWTDVTDKPATFTPSAHDHSISEVTSLQASLDAKAASSHSHIISDTTGLQTALDGKAATSHTHTIANVTNLQSSLDGKAASNHNHDAAYSAIGHNHNGVYEPANANIQAHIASAHAPANAQKNSDITKAEIEAKLTGEISSHSHAGGGGSDPWVSVKLTQDFSTSSSTGVEVTGLNFTPQANQTYMFEAMLFTRTATATVGPRPGVAWPLGLVDGIAMVQQTSSATANVVANGNMNATVLAPVGGLPNTTQSFPAYIWGSFVTGATPSSTLRVFLASETSGTNVTVKAGSYIRYRIV